MAGYEGFLEELLRPLGGYSFEERSFSRGELAAAGAALDEVGTALEEAEREMILTTAEGEGLERRAALFALAPVDAGGALRRAALMALEQVGNGSFTLAALNGAVRGCGIAAEVEEMGRGRLRVRFPGTVGIPDGFEQIRRVVLELLPCHLETEFFFRYITWAECEGQGFTWEMLEKHTWGSFEVAVPA